MAAKNDLIGAQNISKSNGLIFIFEILDNLIGYMVKKYKSEEMDNKDITEEILFKRIKEGKLLIRKGKSISEGIKSELNNINILLNNIPVLDTDFKKAQEGLKDASNVAEEATLKIQDASISIQDSLDSVNNYLTQIESLNNVDKKAKEVLQNCTKEISSVADTTFNIMTALQFQDILRQQLSAVGQIITQTKTKIKKSIKIIEGAPVEAEESKEQFVATDESILDKSEGQDEIDMIISQQLSKK